MRAQFHRQLAGPSVLSTEKWKLRLLLVASKLLPFGVKSDARMKGNVVPCESQEQLVLLPWHLWDITGIKAHLELVGEELNVSFFYLYNPFS